MNYLGDFTEDVTVYLMFNTYTSNDPSASSTITNFANTDVHIHKDDGLTQRNNAAGITVSVDFDGITGSHMVKIDTSDDTVGGFWVASHDYFVRIEGTTIDGATINSVVGHFSIENRFNEVDVTKWLGTAAATPTVAGVPEVDVTHWIGTAAATPTVAGVPEVDITHLLGTAWLTPGVAGTPDVNTKLLGGTSQTGNDVGADVNDILADTGELQTDWADGGRLDLIQDIIAVDTTTDIPALIGTAQADLDTITGADGVTLATAQALYAPNVVVPDVAGTAATPAEVATALTNIHLDHLLAVDYDPASKPGVATALLNELVESDGGISRFTENSLEQAPSGTGASAAVIADAVWDEAQADHVGAGTFGITASEIASILGDTDELQTDWTNGGRLDLLLDAIPTTAMRGTDNAALAATALTDVTWTDAKAGYIDHAISTVDTNVDTLLTRVTAAVALASICTETRLAELDSGNLPTDIADVPTVAEFNARTIVSADYLIASDTLATVTNLTNAPTSGDLTATMKTSVNTEAKYVIATDTIADSYATDGSQPTIAQAILAIQQMMQEMSISGTTMTVKKPDGSTTAMTFTLDDATTPTTITRAT